MKRRYVEGYLDMGKPRTPPFPQALVFTDRADGTEYLLSHTGSVGSLTISLNSAGWSLPDRIVFPAGEEPVIAPGIRVYVNNGSLAGEVLTGTDALLRSPRLLTRKNFERTMLEITADADGVLSYTEITI